MWIYRHRYVDVDMNISTYLSKFPTYLCLYIHMYNVRLYVSTRMYTILIVNMYLSIRCGLCCIATHCNTNHRCGCIDIDMLMWICTYQHAHCNTNHSCSRRHSKCKTLQHTCNTLATHCNTNHNFSQRHSKPRQKVRAHPATMHHFSLQHTASNMQLTCNTNHSFSKRHSKPRQKVRAHSATTRHFSKMRAGA